MNLLHLLDGHVEVDVPIHVGEGFGPFGQRRIFEVKGGSFSGDRFRGKILASGADWALIGRDEILRLDVRSAFETDDGADIYVQAYGIAVINDAVKQALATGGEVAYGDTYFMTHPRFETADPRYEWLNAVVAVGQGRFGKGWVEYRIFTVEN